MMPRALLTAAITAFLFQSAPAAAQTMEELETLDFGLFSLRNNDAQYDLVISAATGNVTADPQIILAGDPPQRGEYRLEGLPSGTEVTITVDPGGLTLGGGGGAPVFTIVDYTVHPTPVMTDGSGIATFYIGATLRTLGDMNIYDSGTYEDDLDITFDW